MMYNKKAKNKTNRYKKKPLKKSKKYILVKHKLKKRINRKKKFIKLNFIILIVILIIFIALFLIFFNIKSIKIIILHLFNISIDYLNIYIVTHKDFNNTLNNQYYKIICDNKTQLLNQYQIEIIETYKNNELYSKKRGYCEGSKIYYIWKNYKQKKIVSKYVGFVHYRRFFNFTNNIPNLDEIFTKYDAIINTKIIFDTSVKTQFSNCHFKKFLDEIEEIIKENFTEYYPQSQKTLYRKVMNCCNIFIMKKEDFINYGEFVFGVLLEFDRRHNLKNDKDIQDLIELEIKRTGKLTNKAYQCRQEGFLMERISSIFYDYKFEKRLEIPIIFQ